MLPFDVELKNGPPIYEQLLYAAKKAIVSGRLKPGDAFPSVRAISRELRINPNTVQKTVGFLRREGFLEAQAGVGTVVSWPRHPSPWQRAELLEDELEALVVRAKELSMEQDEVVNAIRQHWERL